MSRLRGGGRPVRCRSRVRSRRSHLWFEGIGASIAANKIKGVRAGCVNESYAAHQGVEHDDMNVLVLGSRVLGIEVAREALKAFLGAEFSGEERHIRRLNKLLLIEERGR